jgi:quinol-cytochrome oxidoreductase complex cytochrome b subunit
MKLPFIPPKPPPLDRVRKDVTQNEVWKSIFRHSYQDNQRNRALQIVDNVFLHLHPVRVTRHATNYAFTWGMGGTTFLLFIVLTITGVILMFYYRPTEAFAYNDMKALMNDVSFGPFLRNMHRWSAHLMVITVMLHMFRVFLTGSYKPPRQFNWGIGVILLLLTFLLSFTGYLLPWDQLAIWAVTVGTNMARSVPLQGSEGPFSNYLGLRPDNDIRFILLGGTQVGEPTLLRFYVGHCIFLPFIAATLMAVHFWRVRKDGGISGPVVDTKASAGAKFIAEKMSVARLGQIAGKPATNGNGKAAPVKAPVKSPAAVVQAASPNPPTKAATAAAFAPAAGTNAPVATPAGTAGKPLPPWLKKS